MSNSMLSLPLSPFAVKAGQQVARLTIAASGGPWSLPRAHAPTRPATARSVPNRALRTLRGVVTDMLAPPPPDNRDMLRLSAFLDGLRGTHA